MSSSAAKLVTCSRCTRTAKGSLTVGGDPKVPKNWKRIADELVCKDCIEKAYVRRSVWLPVASVVSGYEAESWSEEEHKAGWKAFRKALRTSWVVAAQFFNWAVDEFLRTDTEAPIPNKKKPQYMVPGPWKRQAAVQMVRSKRFTRFPNLNTLIDSQSMYSIMAAAERAYSQNRFDRQILCRERLPCARSGRLPLPVPFKTVHSFAVVDRIILLRLRISGERFTVKMQGGHRFRRNLKAIESCLPEDRVGELQIKERDSNVMIGFSLLLPRTPGQREEIIMRITTVKDRLWQVFVGDSERPWNLNDDQLRQTMAGYRARLQRISEDLKMERRRPHQHSRSFEQARDDMAVKYAHRLSDYCHKAAQIVAGLAKRTKVCKVEYDDREQSYMEGFQWHNLRSKVKEKLEANGIEFVHIEADPGAEEPGSQE